MEYKIYKNEWHDRHGKVTQDYYTIKYKKRFLWRDWWFWVKHKEGYESGCDRTITSFYTLQSAMEFAENCLGKGIKHDAWNMRLVHHNKEYDTN